MLCSLFSIVVLLFCGTNGLVVGQRMQSRVYSNPQTNFSLDAFLVVDTSSTNLNSVQFGQLKVALRNMIQELGSGSLRTTILFYGSSNIVDIVHSPTNDTESIERIKTKIEQKQFKPSVVQNPSTLTAAFGEVDRICSISCRNRYVPRVTLVLTSAARPLADKTQTERLKSYQLMTVITVGIGNQVDSTALSLIASQPHAYAIPLDSYPTLITSTEYITSLISSVPPALFYSDSPPRKYYGSNDLDLYNTVHYIVTYPKDHVVILDFETNACCNAGSKVKVYASILEPMPTDDNTEEARSHTSEECNGLYRFKYYVYVPQYAKRLYISFIVRIQTQTVKYQVSTIDYQAMMSTETMVETGATFPFYGVQLNLNPSWLPNSWSLCYTATYVASMNLMDQVTIFASCNKTRLLLGCRPVGNRVFTVAAMGNRIDVLYDCDSKSNCTHVANGVGWYYSNSHSWGFASGSDTVTRNSCDNSASNAAYRLCWHTAGPGGWRCGASTGLDTSSTWEKVIYHAN